MLAHKKEIKKLESLTVQRGLTLIPTKVYFNQQGRAKVEIALARGKHTFDKRKKLKDDITERETQRALKRFRKG